MIEIKDIYKSFGDNEVLKGISGQFKPGVTNLIIGGSGSGKTTLLKCMIGLHHPEKGSVEYDGREFTSMNFEEKIEIRKEIGMLFQGSALFDSMTVEENIMFP
jgi:phospholipid/cholesterol/gamma-HCH transport system ATP-binding protein